MNTLARKFTFPLNSLSYHIQFSTPVMSISDNAKFSKDHEYVDIVDGNQALIGVTDHAQGEIGDVVHVELPEVGDTFEVGESFATIESVKAAADVYAPVSGKVIEVNTELESDPSVVNSAAETDGWLCKFELTEPSQVDELMNTDDYKEFIA